MAMTNPSFGPSSRTPGVARAWRPRKQAAVTNASDTRNRRASERRRAVTPIAQPSAAASAAVPRTNQKWAGWCSHVTSAVGMASNATNPTIGASTATSTTTSMPRSEDCPGIVAAPSWSGILTFPHR